MVCYVFVLLSAIHKHEPTNILGFDTQEIGVTERCGVKQTNLQQIEDRFRGKSRIQRTGAWFYHNLYLFILFILIIQYFISHESTGKHF